MGFSLYHKGHKYAIKKRRRLAKARLLGSHTKEQWEELKLFFSICVKCEGKSGYSFLEKDHIIPLYLNGSDSIRNLQPLCALCNSSKTNDCTDYRLIYCAKNNLKMPEAWHIDSTSMAAP